MPINSRRKGKTGEREVAKHLERWWNQVEPGCKFVSTPLSGGFSTAQIRGAFNMAGDLMTTAKTFPFTVEVKHRERWELPNVLAGKRSPAWTWWLQCQKAAAEEKKIPMMWFRKNYGDWYMMLPERDYLRVVPDQSNITWMVAPKLPKADIGQPPVVFLALEVVGDV